MSSQQPEQQALKWRLRLIFLYYASYADKNNYKLLKSQNYKRFLIDSESVIQQAGFAPFDIAFRKVHSSSIRLDQFLELLPVIAQLVYRNKNRKDAFRLYITHHMEKLYNQILSHSQFGADVIAIQNLVVEKESIDILNSGALQKAYHKYIESTSMHQKEPDQTFEQLHTLLSDFEISPKLVYKAMAYVAFYYQIQLTNTKYWGLHNLQELLVCYAELHWRRIQEDFASQDRKLTRLLQHMQTSIGFKKMVEKHRKQNAMQITFFKRPVKIITELNDSFEKERHSPYEKSQPMSTRSQYVGKYSSTKRDKQVDIGPIITLLDDQNDTVGQLRQIFERLCSHGEVGNTQTLKSIKIKRYFKGLNILAELEQTWVDITITDLCRTSQSGKIEFPHFLQLLQIVAAKLNIDEEGFYHYLIDHCQAEPGVTNSYFSKVSTARQVHQPRALNIFLQIKKPLEKIFNHFRVGRKGLSFDQLTHALYEFQIFPSFINKSTLYSYFQIRAKATSEVKKLVGETSLDFVGFLEVLTDISRELGESLTEQERVIFVLERMQDSQGHRNLLGSEGSNLIGDLRSKYAHIYQQNIAKNSPKKPEGFEELLQDISP